MANTRTITIEADKFTKIPLLTWEENPGRGAIWLGFIEFCSKLGYGEIEKLKIQDGLPMLAEKVTEKVKFNKT